VSLHRQLKKHGLFAAPLNNGDWMVGRANCVYSLDIRADHYADERLAIGPTLAGAIEKWVQNNRETSNKESEENHANNCNPKT
jgi:hypothetical protein